jgi:hypothetical protein
VNPFYPGQITDSSCRVILDVDSCSIHDCHLKALLGYGTRCRGIVDIVSMRGVFEVMGEVWSKVGGFLWRWYTLAIQVQDPWRWQISTLSINHYKRNKYIVGYNEYEVSPLRSSVGRLIKVVEPRVTRSVLTD